MARDAVKRLWLVGVLAVAACGAPSPVSTIRPTQDFPTPRATISASPTVSPTPTATTAPNGIVTTGHGWTAAGLQGPRYSAGACHARTSNGQIVPDAACTPGGIDAAVTQATIRTTICVRGYTTTIRPPQSLTGPAKTESAREYGYTGTGEYDHLIPLELGGASDTRNLWIEPGSIPNAKDGVEGHLRAEVCAGSLPLATAQQEIATDWTAAR